MFFIDYSRKDGRLKGIRDAKALKKHFLQNKFSKQIYKKIEILFNFIHINSLPCNITNFNTNYFKASTN